jgi:hypothetical protein
MLSDKSMADKSCLYDLILFGKTTLYSSPATRTIDDKKKILISKSAGKALNLSKLLSGEYTKHRSSPPEITIPILTARLESIPMPNIDLETLLKLNKFQTCVR